MRWFHIVIVIALLFGAKTLINRFFDQSVYRGPWYQVDVPEGWERSKDDDTVMFFSPETDLFTEKPQAMFSIYTKQETAIFLDDLFVDVLNALGRVKGKVIDKGEIKIDEQKAKWVLFHNMEYELVILTFYIVDDWNRLTQIQYATSPASFKKYRPEFEEFKNSIKYKKLF